MWEDMYLFILWGRMNIFRFLGDMCHLFAMLLLLYKITKTKSCIGVSGRTQILLLIVFLTRYSDLFVYFLSMYNTGMKMAYIACTLTTVCLIYGRFRKTYEQEYDTVHIGYVITPCLIAAMFINYEFVWNEVLWSFSIYLEAVAIIPQLCFTRKRGFTKHMIIYLLALGSYRSLYILNWIFRYVTESHLDYLSLFCGVTQTLIFAVFFCLGCRKPANEGREIEVSVIDCKKPSPLDMNLNDKDRQLLIDYIQRKEISRPDIKTCMVAQNSENDCKVDIDEKTANVM